MALTVAQALAAQQTRMTNILARQTFWLTQQQTNQNNAATIAASLDAINYAIKDCQSKIDTLNAAAGNATNPDPTVP